ncbi:hypothetical protein [Yoonia sediminilitoris]|uniref:Transferrin-binding protein B C-lobe/N-lobe beta barrel domain-containing protein n=1 Tax=Yoonia sediminilitoris TaxID=1286148 RepID=A0A2T6K9P6_9RHOB|nr:hypothetical protein [Yoonia sediminilitoris]PUB11490.1 hypothetical protein C8N45_1136 [Yoonia sediminilitoris]RCW91690.1 hypothetical protein DFP92_1136 [Yoonia sediminilitoris]
MRNFVTGVAALALLGACATPNPPTVTSRAVDRAFDGALEIANLPIAQVDDLPTGTVTYDGQIGADVEGDQLGSVLADMTMIVGFASNDIKGDVTNINLIDQNGDPDQRFDGTLLISGIESNGNLDAGASGLISGVDGSGRAVESDLNLDLEGTVRNGMRDGDSVYGSVTGEARGDLDLTFDGVFFGNN